jgi:crotonobetainyl-CoA:carnitine CoA-transferase CaiB-like acyl-CoA transferase
MTLIGSGFKLAHGGGSVNRAPAVLGEHTDEILAEADYSPDEIDAMRGGGLF